MKILLLGGTGAMGVPLCRLMKKEGHNITVTSRNNHRMEGISFVKGNAMEINFISKLLEVHYDAVVDFMIRSEEGTKAVMDIILRNCDQYIFLSSSRVFAPINIEDGERITENTPRLLDVCGDNKYTSSNEYAIEKAREENLFFKSNYRNWTIVRPTLTYNINKFQFAYGEKEDWLFRVLNNHSIVFPKDMVNVKTTMVYGDDVAMAISKLIGNKKALGKAVNIVSEEYMTWGDILNIYKEVIEKKQVKKLKVVYIDNIEKLTKLTENYYQVKYARAVDRCFSNKGLKEIVGNSDFISIKTGLTKSMTEFLENIHFQEINWKKQALYDKICNEKFSCKTMSSMKDTLRYLSYRYIADWILLIIRKIKFILKNIINKNNGFK